MGSAKLAAATALLFGLPVIVSAANPVLSGGEITRYAGLTVISAIILHISTLIAKIDAPSILKAFVCAVLLQVAQTFLALFLSSLLPAFLGGYAILILNLLIAYYIILSVYRLASDRAIMVMVVNWILGMIFGSFIAAILLAG